MLVYKIDVMQELKDNGYSTYKMLKEGLLAQGTLTKIRNGNTDISLRSLNQICKMIDMQPGNIIKYIPDEK